MDKNGSFIRRIASIVLDPTPIIIIKTNCTNGNSAQSAAWRLHLSSDRSCSDRSRRAHHELTPPAPPTDKGRRPQAPNQFIKPASPQAYITRKAASKKKKKPFSPSPWGRGRLHPPNHPQSACFCFEPSFAIISNAKAIKPMHKKGNQP